MDFFIGIDLGGTNIVSGVVNSNYQIISKAKKKTNLPRSSEEIIQDMYATVLEAAEKANLFLDQIKYIGIAIPGVVDSKNGVVPYSNNLQFYDVHISDRMHELTDLPVFIDNDANAAALGEFSVRKDQGINNLVAITLGTGVGSGAIVDGRLIRGFNSAASELGHTVIKFEGYPCTCGRKGCFEVYASATGLIRLTKEKMQKEKDSLMWELVDNSIDKVDGQTPFDALRQGDSAAKDVVDLYLKYLACGITNAVNTFQPEIICIGGGVSNQGLALIDPITKILSKKSFSRYCKEQTKVVTAVLGNDAGLIGAAMLGLEEVL